MAGEQKMRIKVESPTSEFRVEVKESDKVRDLIKIVKQAWGTEYMTLHCNSAEMHGDQPLSAYNLRDGSVIKDGEQVFVWSIYGAALSHMSTQEFLESNVLSNTFRNCCVP
nr:hypothetical protein A4A49_13655 [Ipomoea batatas]